jgi:multidrug resistance protein
MKLENKDSEKSHDLADIAPSGTVSNSAKENDLSNGITNELSKGNPSQNNSIVDGGSNVNYAKHDCATQRDLESDNTTATNKDQHGWNGRLSIPHSVFPKSTRTFIIVMAAVCAFVSPISGNIYFPALNGLSASLHVSQSLLNISLTTYMIFQGLAPTLIGDLADKTGRRPAYIIGFTIYIGACIGLALQNSYPVLLILRCLQAIGSSSSIALAAAVAADVSTSQDRGTYMGWVNGGALAGPAIGPVLGGILAQFLGWRAIFWFLVIFTGILMLPLIVVFPETCRNVVGNGSIPPQRWNRDLLSVIRERRARRHETSELQRSAREEKSIRKTKKFQFPNPLSTLKILKEKDVALLLLYNCLVYSSYYSVTSSLPYLFEQTYHFNALQIGLSFIPYGVGALLASLLNGRILDWRFRQVANSLGIEIKKGQTTDTRHFPLEKVRLPIALVLILIGNSALLCYGWVSCFSFWPRVTFSGHS